MKNLLTYDRFVNESSMTSTIVWIKTEDEIPKKESIVLALWPGRAEKYDQIKTARFIPKKNEKFGYWSDDSHGLTIPMYWAHIPSSPIIYKHERKRGTYWYLNQR